MKFVIGLIIVIALAMGGYHLYEYWGKFKNQDQQEQGQTAQSQDLSGQTLPGMPSGQLESILIEAEKHGATGLHDFLQTYGKQIKDPRLAWIELDYVVLVSQSSPGEARQKFQEVKARVGPDSPVYPRIQQLEKTYE